MSKRVFGLDPGVAKAGWAIVYDGHVEDQGVFSPQSTKEKFNDKINEELQRSLVFFREKLKGVDAVAWEIVPSFGNFSQRDRVVAVATALKIVTWDFKLPWVGRVPQKIKSLATGNNKATKAMMKAEAYRRFPDLPDLGKTPVDVYDAILIAEVARIEDEWEGYDD